MNAVKSNEAGVFERIGNAVWKVRPVLTAGVVGAVVAVTAVLSALQFAAH
jgi:hypothetical protein